MIQNLPCQTERKGFESFERRGRRFEEVFEKRTFLAVDSHGLDGELGHRFVPATDTSLPRVHSKRHFAFGILNSEDETVTCDDDQRRQSVLYWDTYDDTIACFGPAR